MSIVPGHMLMCKCGCMLIVVLRSMISHPCVRIRPVALALDLAGVPDVRPVGLVLVGLCEHGWIIG